MNISLGGRFGKGKLITTYVLCLIFIVIGFFAWSASKIDSSWIKTQGKIVSFEASTREVSSSSQNSTGGTNNTTRTETVYKPTLEYTVDGQTYKIESSAVENNQDGLGQMRQIAYNPSNPSEAKADIGAVGILFLIVFVLGGALFAIVGTILYKRANSQGSAASASFTPLTNNDSSSVAATPTPTPTGSQPAQPAQQPPVTPIDPNPPANPQQ